MINTQQLFETIAIIDGKVQNLSYHQARYERGMAYLQQLKPKLLLETMSLADLIQVPESLQQGVVRCRIDYDYCLFDVVFSPYQAKQIQRFKMIEVDDIEYTHKFSDRTIFEQLQQEKGLADEIIIVKNGLITDCTIGNLLFLKHQQWFTPKQPLLAGTQRAKLLDDGFIQLEDIGIQELFSYEKIMMVNALNPFDEQRAVNISLDSVLLS